MAHSISLNTTASPYHNGINERKNSTGAMLERDSSNNKLYEGTLKTEAELKVGQDHNTLGILVVSILILKISTD
jgi:hypothetical protein